MTIKLWAITMLKDESDIIDHTLYHLAAEGIDGIIVADNMSTDDSRIKLEEAKAKLPIEVDIIDDNVVAYDQGVKMSGIAKRAADRGATWILPFDADELWFSQQGTLKEVFEKADDDGYTSVKPLYTNHSITVFDPEGDCPFKTMMYKWDRPTNFKEAFKYKHAASISDGSHFVSWEGRRSERPLMDVVEMRHFQWRSKEHFLRKIQNAYKACKALPLNGNLYYGAAWKEHFIVFEEKGIAGLEEMYENEILVKELGTLIYDPAPYKGATYE